MTLSLQLLGGFQLLRDGRPIAGPIALKERALLALLALEQQPQSRGAVAGMLWPRRSEPEARMNLRRALANLRQVPGITLHASREWLGLPPGTLLVDVIHMESAIRAARDAEGDEREQHLASAARLFRGPLLDGFHLRDAPQFDEWLTTQAERVQRLGIHALHELATLATQRRDYLTATDVATRLLSLDPWLEDAHQMLMLVLAERGERGAALAQYEQCRQLLQREFGIEPAAATRALYERIRDGNTATPSRALACGEARRQRTLGRKQEWSQLVSAWRDASQRAGMLVLYGEAGMGKTRLADDLLDWAKRRGSIVASAAGQAFEEGLALAPVREWLRTPAVSATLGALDASWHMTLAPLLPELALPDHAPGSLYALDRMRLFDGLVQALLNAQERSGSAPLVLLIDDIQWCDRDTLEWLHYLLRVASTAPLLILAALRVEDAPGCVDVQSLFAMLRARGQLREVTLQGLERADTAELAARVLRRSISPRQAHRLHDLTRGHPELIIALGKHTEPAAWESADVTLPEAVHATLTQRLERLTPTTREMAGVLAALDGPLCLHLLFDYLETDVRRAAAALGELQRARVLEEAEPMRYVFVNPLLRDTAARDLSPVRRYHLEQQRAHLDLSRSGE
jgi:DNA-binding SARP family transcriptional activator